MLFLVQIARVAAIAVIGLVAIQLSSQSYTDAQIAASFVDTWEVTALCTTATIVVAILGIAAGVLAFYLEHTRHRSRASAVPVTVCLVGAAMVQASHAALTNRVTQITGQSFSGIWGLF